MTVVVAPPVMRWCYRCREQFAIDQRQPKAKICTGCASTHPDKRVRRRFLASGRR